MVKKNEMTILSGIAISSVVIAILAAVQLQQLAIAQNSSNPLAKVPVIGQLMGGGKGGNATSASGNTTNSSSAGNQNSSNPLAKVPVIGQLLGGK